MSNLADSDAMMKKTGMFDEKYFGMDDIRDFNIEEVDENQYKLDMDGPGPSDELRKILDR